MRRIPTSMCRPGMKLGQPIISEKGIVLLKNGIELNPIYIQKLIDMGYDYLFIDDLETEDIVIEDPLREKTRACARIQLRNVFSAISSDTAIGLDSSIVDECHNVSSMIINDLDYRNHDSFMLTNINVRCNSLEQRWIENALNVCIYAVKMGLIEYMSKKDIMDLCIGALFHDLGSIVTPQHLLDKEGKLTPQELNLVQKHTVNGYHMLRSIQSLPPAAAYCALQHHEKMNGSGYPFNLKGNKIHPFAKWIGIVDAYNAMTNPRPYRKALMPNEALDVLYASAGTLYEKGKVELFRDKVAVFPVGLSVRLSTGEQGIVSKVSSPFMHRPTIRVFKSQSGIQLHKPYEMDLSQHLHVMIREIGEECMH